MEQSMLVGLSTNVQLETTRAAVRVILNGRERNEEDWDSIVYRIQSHVWNADCSAWDAKSQTAAKQADAGLKASRERDVEAELARESEAKAAGDAASREAEADITTRFDAARKLIARLRTEEDVWGSKIAQLLMTEIVTLYKNEDTRFDDDSTEMQMDGNFFVITKRVADVMWDATVCMVEVYKSVARAEEHIQKADADSLRATEDELSHALRMETELRDTIDKVIRVANEDFGNSHLGDDKQRRITRDGGTEVLYARLYFDHRGI
jgi:hypothetical protein